MKTLGLLWVIAGTLGLATCAYSSDSPPLEPPSPGSLPGASSGNAPGSRVLRDGPPRVPVEERVGPAPGPGSFYIPGQYVPAGDRVNWRPGFWARSQPGWEWVPARWVRLSEGWSYRDGHWERTGDPIPGSLIVSQPSDALSPPPDAAAGGDPAPSSDPRRHVVARPSSPFGTDPTVPAASPPGDPDPGATTDLVPLPEANPPTTPRSGPGAGPGPVITPPPPPPAADLSPVPPPPRGLEPDPQGPAAVVPGLPGRLPLPVTDIYAPNGLHIRVVPGQIPYIGFDRLGPPGVLGPPVVDRPLRPLREVRGRIRDLIRGPLP